MVEENSVVCGSFKPNLHYGWVHNSQWRSFWDDEGFTYGSATTDDNVTALNSETAQLLILFLVDKSGIDIHSLLITRNQELPAKGTNSFYPRQDDQRSIHFRVMESLASDEIVDTELGKEIGSADLELPAGVTRDTEIQVTFYLDESGLLSLHAKEMKNGREVVAKFQTTEALSEQEMSDAIRRSNNSEVN